MASSSVLGFHVHGMTCSHCVGTVTSTIQGVPQVEKVQYVWCAVMLGST